MREGDGRKQLEGDKDNSKGGLLVIYRSDGPSPNRYKHRGDQVAVILLSVLALNNEKIMDWIVTSMYRHDFYLKVTYILCSIDMSLKMFSMAKFQKP